MGSLFGGAPKPPPIPVLPPAATPATMANPAVVDSANRQRQKAAGSMAGNTSNPQALQAAPATAGLTLLGGTK